MLGNRRTLITRTVIDSLQYGINGTDGASYSTVTTSNLNMTEQYATSDNTEACSITPHADASVRSTWCSCTQKFDGTPPSTLYPPSASPFWWFQTVLVSGTETNATVRVFAHPRQHAVNNSSDACVGDTIYTNGSNWGQQNGTSVMYVYEKSGVDLTSPISFTTADITHDRYGKYRYYETGAPSYVCDGPNNEYIWKLDFTVTVKQGM